MYLPVLQKYCKTLKTLLRGLEITYTDRLCKKTYYLYYKCYARKSISIYAMLVCKISRNAKDRGVFYCYIEQIFSGGLFVLCLVLRGGNKYGVAFLR